MGTLVENKFGLYRKYLERFVVFSDEEWAVFQSHLRFKNVPKKTTLVDFGKVENEISYIVEGAVRFYINKDGEQITNYFCFSNELISAYRSFILRQPTVIAMEALEDTELISFTHASLQQMYADPKICYKMEQFGRKIGEYLICCYEERLLSFITQSPEERYLQLLQNGKNIIRQIPQHYIAHFLGITPVSLSRIRKRILEPVDK